MYVGATASSSTSCGRPKPWRRPGGGAATVLADGSERMEPDHDLLRHEGAALFEEVVVTRDVAVEHRVRDAVHSQVRAHFALVGDGAVQPGAAMALLGELAEVGVGRAVTDRYIDLALRQNEVGDLVVTATGQALLSSSSSADTHGGRQCGSEAGHER